jgi:hypothetical protein
VTTLARVVETAIALFRERHPRSTYGVDVLGGAQQWSGADLRGKANTYSGSYARMRRAAARCLAEAGGCIVALKRTGLRVTAVRLPDGTYETRGGILTAAQLRRAS